MSQSRRHFRCSHADHRRPTIHGFRLRQGRRYAVARRLAGLFASYARQRPQLLVDWLDGNTNDLVGDLRWQPELYKALVGRIDADPPHIRHAKIIARLEESLTDLPTRLSLFGHTRLASTDIELLQALATHHDIHLWLPHPSDNLWQKLKDQQGPIPRRADSSRHAAHPLLETLGRDLRELQRSLPQPQTDEYLGGATKPDTLLGWLQQDIAANEIRPQRRRYTPQDRSVQVHSCHGAHRQIEVLRDVLLGLLQDDPTLEPRDILVMCPDIETFAPLIVANFGLGDVAGERHPAHRLRVRLADRSPVQTNPLLSVAAQLLDIADTRATANQVLSFAQAPPVRARFGFSDDDLATITEWVRQSGIRWGFDADHRLPYGLDQYPQNTWRFGLNRILTGVALSDDSQSWIDTALPLDDVGSSKVELAGRLAEFVARLAEAAQTLSGCQDLTTWLDALRAGVEDLTRVWPADAWQLAQLEREFSKVLVQSGSRARTALRLSDVRSLLDGHLAGRPTRANFRTGTLTVCTMVPMRSVPHRVVCLVGLDDGVFPRVQRVDGDDALGRCPMTGERDISSEDRQLLLDAICAATEKLVITYSGFDEHTGQDRPPAVPLQEILDALDRTTPTKVRGQIEIAHPLQPFDVRNIKTDALIPGQPFTFDPTALKAARAAAGEWSAPKRFYSTPLAERAADDVALADLLRFFKHPVEGYFRELDYTLPWDVDKVEDAIPVDIDALHQWEIGDRILANLMRGMDLEIATTAEQLRGTLPPGELGERIARELSDECAELAMAAARFHTRQTSAHDVDIDLVGRHLTGTVTPVYTNRLVSVTYSRLSAKHLLQSWITVVALSAQLPGQDWSAVCVGRGDKKDELDVKVRCFVAPPDPVAVLRDLLAIFDAGRREPLPLPLKTSCGWAEKRRQGRNPFAFAEHHWEKCGDASEQKDKAHEKIWGRDAPLADLLDDVPRPGEEYPGEDTRLGALAMRLWLPLLDSERSP